MNEPSKVIQICVCQHFVNAGDLRDSAQKQLNLYQKNRHTAKEELLEMHEKHMKMCGGSGCLPSHE